MLTQGNVITISVTLSKTEWIQIREDVKVKYFGGGCTYQYKFRDFQSAGYASEILNNLKFKKIL